LAAIEATGTCSNLVVGTTNNNAPIAMSVKKAATGLIKNGMVTEGLLNHGDGNVVAADNFL
jgi:coenzyme F420-reducing hydrogenase alpha subunit